MCLVRLELKQDLSRQTTKEQYKQISWWLRKSARIVSEKLKKGETDGRNAM